MGSLLREQRRPFSFYIIYNYDLNQLYAEREGIER